MASTDRGFINRAVDIAREVGNKSASEIQRTKSN